MKLFVCVCAVMMMMSTVASAATFSDVPRSHWAYDAMQKAVDAGILQGFDGKFEGSRLLDRYQMAVVVAKLLEGVKAAPAGKFGTPDEAKKMVGNLEALTIEFADELALLNVKVATLEDGIRELKAQCGELPTAAPAAGGLGFTAFASFGLIKTDEQASFGCVDASVLSDDSINFDLPQVSLGVDHEVDPGVFFHAQFDFDSYVNGGPGNGVAVNEAYFIVDDLCGALGAKVGAFALPFSMEHVGPFRTCDLTITPSFANSFVESVRVYGFEIQPTSGVKPGSLTWKAAFVSGTDPVDLSGPLSSGAAFSTVPVSVNGAATEGDDQFGYYLMLARKPAGTCALGWHVGVFDNGGDERDGSLETNFYDVAFEWSRKDVRVLAQYLDGTTKDLGGTDYDLTSFYLLVNYAIDARQSVSLRWDDGEIEVSGAPVWELTSLTVAYNRKVTENSLLQFEYVSPDTRVGATPDLVDNLLQVRYKVHF